MAQRNQAVERISEVIEKIEVIENWCGLPEYMNRKLSKMRIELAELNTELVKVTLK